MPVIAANPVNSVHNATLIGAKPVSTPKTPETKKEALAASLARTDAYVNSTAVIAENAILSIFNSYQDTQSAVGKMNKDGAMVVTDFIDVGGSVKRAAIQRTVTSSMSNGWALVRGKVTLAEAGGRVVGDVSTTAVANGMGALATNVAVWGIAKAGGSSLPVIVGGMVAGWAANNLSHRMMGKFGVTEAITNKTTELLSSVGSNN
ncbi:MAG: hypothetical protein CVV27_13905 [Candidatus Melainabacteria bacterium HGW-Melainabacteria-1]|nr:MAG: hypothetical protein CVV27_13905 [Candidatus Melainabacteria bacterium HGW-Melainabacteria-1]